MKRVGQGPRPKLSHSGYETFDQCERRWILKYGWSRLPLTVRESAIEQRDLTHWHMFAGSVVDAAISRALRYYCVEGHWPPDMHRLALQTMSWRWEFSEEWAQRALNGLEKPPVEGYQPLERHYYVNPVSKKEWEAAKERIFLCVDNFMASDLPEFITQFPVGTWRGPRPPEQKPPQFRVGSIPLWAAFDFAVQTPDVTYIFDWKTSEPSVQSCWRSRQQLLWYALFAVVEWKVPVENVRVCPVWLRPRMDWGASPVTEDELNDLVGRIADRYELLSTRLQESSSWTVSLDQWPLTDDLKECASCVFRGVCEGAKRIQVNGAPVVEKIGG